MSFDIAHKKGNLNFVCHLPNIFIRCKIAFDKHDTPQIIAMIPLTYINIQSYRKPYEEYKLGVAIRIYSHENHRFLSQHHSLKPQFKQFDGLGFIHFKPTFDILRKNLKF